MKRTRPDESTEEFKTLAAVRDKAERDCIQLRLEHFHFKFDLVAKSLDISRVHLVNLRTKHDLNYSEG